ncbi:hypothetical protein QUW58_15045, partial [Enterocloster aldenensis]|uniref:hypothetical protein n=1 Tax=Enterocloster aldenensis TaxID=358742 RepID=UPI0025A47946|nr:hypothetical protein [Enterocloster aldenensis]
APRTGNSGHDMCHLRIRVGKMGFWRRFFVAVVALAAFFVVYPDNTRLWGREKKLGDGIGLPFFKFWLGFVWLASDIAV